jgi:predicted Zn finger-like uncharacterized protein
MKFSCPKCSAKYQIADDKVEGRTVKMKCRKCGTTIPIRAEPSKHELATAPLVSAESLRPQPPRGGGALGASASAVEFIAPAPEIALPPPSVEWHAGIDGQTVGPMSVREIERRVGEGSINQETFVWCEGMDGWKQIPDVPELALILTRSRRPITAAPPSMPMQAKAQRVAPQVKAPRAAKPVPRAGAAISPAHPVASHPVISEGTAPMRGRGGGAAAAQVALAAPLESDPLAADPLGAAQQLHAPSPVKSSAVRAAPAPASASGWAEALEGLERPSEAPTLDRASEAQAATAPRVSAAPQVPAAPHVPVAPNPLTTPEAPIPHIDMPEPMSQRLRPSYDSLVMQLQKTRKQHPLVIPFAVLAAVVFGVTIGFVLFGDQKTKIVKQIVEVPAKTAEAAGVGKAEANQGEGDADIPPPGDLEGPTSARPGTGASKAGAGTSAAGTAKPEEVKGLQGLSGLDGLGGPSSGPAGPGSSSASGQPLSSSQIEATVSQYRTSVKRGCWERALMSRDKDAPSSARVTVAISVAPSGSVTGATTSGDPKGYSGLSSCITQRVRGWTFPRSSGPTTVNVPFVFAAQ